MTGVVTAYEIEKGRKVLKDRDFSPFEEFLRDVFEIGRRYKIMNPERMRSEYGKMIFLLQDACSSSAQANLDLQVNKPIVTVYSFLESRNALHILEDPFVGIS